MSYGMTTLMIVPNDHPVRKWKIVDSDGFVYAENMERDELVGYCERLGGYCK